LRAIVPLTEPASPYQRNRSAVFDRQPTLFNDPDLTPAVEGITDQETIENWEAPFPFDIRRMDKGGADDRYWNNHRTTPKAYVSLATAQRLWGSRFGSATSFRIPGSPDVTEQRLHRAVLAKLHEPETLHALGFQFLAVKLDGLSAARGTTSFDSLFLGLSFFIILSAVMLVAILFRLGVEQRGTQLVILTAVGLRQSRALGLLVAEGAIVSGLGGLFGLLVALGYARLLIAALQSKDWWLGAISNPFLTLHSTPTSLLAGYAIGVLVSLAAIYWTCRRLRSVTARRLLAGQTEPMSQLARRRSRWLFVVALLLILAALGTGAAALGMSGMAQAGAFVGGGALTLAALLVLAADRLQSSAAVGHVTNLTRLAASSAARHPARSTLTIGLMSSATFLIVSMSAFRLSPTLAGAGGFPWLARSSVAIFQNLNDPVARRDLLGQDAQALEALDVFSFRLKPGNDASCRNLYRVTQPRVLGVPPELAEYYDGPQRVAFEWAAESASAETHRENPWHLLWNSSANGAVPVVLDQNTATYSLGWKLGQTYDVHYEHGTTLRVKVVGLLSNSIFQGTLLIADDRFRTAFPEISGFRYFLLGGPEQVADRARPLLEHALGDQGFYAVPTRGVLDGLLAVQNTYLSTFQSLGALGLLLGTFGLASVQARSVLERRGELALLRAGGFRRRRVGWLVVLENFALLAVGLAAGVLAAICAVLPHIVFGGASVPVLGVLQLLLIVLAIGSFSGALAVQLALRGSLLAALRGD
jgi:putative ABC transport system permease protein